MPGSALLLNPTYCNQSLIKTIHTFLHNYMSNYVLNVNKHFIFPTCNFELDNHSIRGERLPLTYGEPPRKTAPVVCSHG